MILPRAETCEHVIGANGSTCILRWAHEGPHYDGAGLVVKQGFNDEPWVVSVSRRSRKLAAIAALGEWNHALRSESLSISEMGKSLYILNHFGLAHPSVVAHGGTA